jgi:hypothetical protein
VWTLAENRSVYVVKARWQRGQLVFVDDLDARVAAIAARGTESGERETCSDGVWKVVYCDLDGNERGLSAHSRTLFY